MTKKSHQFDQMAHVHLCVSLSLQFPHRTTYILHYRLSITIKFFFFTWNRISSHSFIFSHRTTTYFKFKIEFTLYVLNKGCRQRQRICVLGWGWTQPTQLNSKEALKDYFDLIEKVCLKIIRKIWLPLSWLRFLFFYPWFYNKLEVEAGGWLIYTSSRDFSMWLAGGLAYCLDDGRKDRVQLSVLRKHKYNRCITVGLKWKLYYREV